MTCRHRDPINNPECSSFRTPEQQVESAKKSIEELRTKFKIKDEPDNSNYDILKTYECDGFLVLSVKYESCEKCSYEGTKTLVFKASVTDALRWRIIDPHFQDQPPTSPKHAPSPIARFPGDETGWYTAIRFMVNESAKGTRK